MAEWLCVHHRARLCSSRQQRLHCCASPSWCYGCVVAFWWQRLLVVFDSCLLLLRMRVCDWVVVVDVLWLPRLASCFYPCVCVRVCLWLPRHRLVWSIVNPLPMWFCALAFGWLAGALFNVIIIIINGGERERMFCPRVCLSSSLWCGVVVVVVALCLVLLCLS